MVARQDFFLKKVDVKNAAIGILSLSFQSLIHYLLSPFTLETISTISNARIIVLILFSLRFCALPITFNDPTPLQDGDFFSGGGFKLTWSIGNISASTMSI
jgi:hypothetical protein